MRGELEVSVTQRLGAEPIALFEEALATAGFWRELERVRRSLRKTRGRLRIVIKPDLDFYDPKLPGGTDPTLVEHLVGLLVQGGYGDVTVGDGRNDADEWLHNREPLAVPDLVGYRFATPQGRAYSFVDLAGGKDATPSVTPISPHWADADFRINFAKNRTHEDCAFALCVHNLAGVVMKRGGGRRRSLPDDCLEVLRRAPPHFNLIDAYVSGHGGAGHRAPRAMATHAFIASTDARLADWVGAARMGLDPYASPVNAAALRSLGVPAPYRVSGDLTPYPLWRNVHPMILRSARQRNGSDALGAIAAGWFQSLDRERFALRDFYSDRLNSFIAPLMTRIDENPRSFAAVVLLNLLIARIDGAVVAQQTLFAKHRLRQRVAPLTIDPAEYGPADYDAIAGYLQPYEQLLAGTPPNRDGLRWRLVDGSVLFSCSHVLPIAFERFARKVDITRSIQYMNDYIGGSTVAIRRDSRGRVTQQAERNLYLQQPNWLVLFGGELIDVEKLESIRHARDSQTICWRTVRSPNDSARFDDGSVRFERSGAGETTVRIFARQQFSLPLAFRLFDVDLAPGFRDPIIESAYTNFFAGTIANLQAAYDGREFRIGRSDEAQQADAPGDVGQELPRYLATAAAAAAELLRHRGDVADLTQWLFGPGETAMARQRPVEVDSDGFRHFVPAAADAVARGDARAMVAGMAGLMRDAPDMLTGLVDAVQKDLDLMATPPAPAT